MYGTASVNKIDKTGKTSVNNKDMNNSIKKSNASMNKGTENISKTNMYEEMASWGTGQLKDYLMVRGISYSGTRQEILSGTFVAWEQKSEIRMGAKELQNFNRNMKLG